MKASMLLALFLSLAEKTLSARFLAVLPMNSKSHSIWHYSIFELLTRRGHEVVVYGTLPPPRPIANVTFIEMQNIVSFLAENWTFEQLEELFHELYFGIQGKIMFDYGVEICTGMFENENIQKLLQSEEKFDLVFLEATVAQESSLVFGHKFKAPVINLQGFPIWSPGNWVTGNPLSIAHIPDGLSFPFTNKMSFTERLKNFISTIGTLILYHYDHLSKQEKLIQKYYKDRNTPAITDMISDISITLANGQTTVGYPRPFQPNIQMVGGVHIASHNTPLPKDIKKFMDKSKEGVIYFSLGTFIPAHRFPQEYIQAFVTTFRKLPHKILWKISLDNIPNLPPNVKLTKWVPQPTILAHPNCVLFVTHGGLYSQLETLHAGVPVVAVPFFSEQRYNTRLYEHLGVGIQLDFITLTEESVTKAMTTVLSNPSYKQNARRLSRIVCDKPQPLEDSVVFWVEYVLRHQGAHHLRPASATMAWYQLALLDVLAVISTAALLSFIIIYKLMKSVFKICFGKSVSTISKNKKQD